MSYKLQKGEVINGIVNHFPKTIKASAGFVASTTLMGSICGYLYSMPINPNTAIIDTTDNTTVLIVGVITSAYLAKEVYKNFKQERKRVHDLALQIEKDKRQHMASFDRLNSSESIFGPLPEANYERKIR